MKAKRFLLIVVTLFLLSIPNVFAANEWLGKGETVSCGGISNIPKKVPQLVHTGINIVEVVVPVLLVIFGAIDLAKSVMSQKEDDIKKGQKTLIKRVVMGMIVFLVIALTKLLVNLVAEGKESKESIVSCINCFMNGECK